MTAGVLARTPICFSCWTCEDDLTASFGAREQKMLATQGRLYRGGREGRRGWRGSGRGRRPRRDHRRPRGGRLDADGDAFGSLAVEVAAVEAIDVGEVLKPVVAEVRHRLPDPGGDRPILGGELFVAVLRDAEREPFVGGAPVMEGTGHTLGVSGLRASIWMLGWRPCKAQPTTVKVNAGCCSRTEPAPESSEVNAYSAGDVLIV